MWARTHAYVQYLRIRAAAPLSSAVTSRPPSLAASRSELVSAPFLGSFSAREFWPFFGLFGLLWERVFHERIICLCMLNLCTHNSTYTCLCGTTCFACTYVGPKYPNPYEPHKVSARILPSGKASYHLGLLVQAEVAKCAFADRLRFAVPLFGTVRNGYQRLLATFQLGCSP